MVGEIEQHVLSARGLQLFDDAAEHIVRVADGVVVGVDVLLKQRIDLLPGDFRFLLREMVELLGIAVPVGDVAAHDVKDDQRGVLAVREGFADIVDQASVELVFVVFWLPRSEQRGNGILAEVLLRGIGVDVVARAVQHGHDRGTRMQLVVERLEREHVVQREIRDRHRGDHVPEHDEFVDVLLQFGRRVAVVSVQREVRADGAFPDHDHRHVRRAFAGQVLRNLGIHDTFVQDIHLPAGIRHFVGQERKPRGGTAQDGIGADPGVIGVNPNDREDTKPGGRRRQLPVRQRLHAEPEKPDDRKTERSGEHVIHHGERNDLTEHELAGFAPGGRGQQIQRACMQRHVKPQDHIAADEETERGKKHQDDRIHPEQTSAQQKERRKREDVSRQCGKCSGPFQRQLVALHEDARQIIRPRDQKKIHDQEKPNAAEQGIHVFFKAVFHGIRQAPGYWLLFMSGDEASRSKVKY